jgi:predicted nucleic acid-binding protein
VAFEAAPRVGDSPAAATDAEGGLVNWLLDTNTISELTKPNASPTLLLWMQQNEEEAGLSAITIGEVTFGVELLPEGKKRRQLERSLAFLREDYAGKIFDFTQGVAVEWGRLMAEARKAGRNLSLPDSQIEATAIHFGLTVVSRNHKDFFHPVVAPW